ncbi:survival protein sure-like phosphatase/nucleotidase [Kockovaella imperatae]|uniref:Survival protein sure-like phosphatase/nucleotidase n=1 Tax=Kockovaella imperatae TaxID=4999 RepID=A0A1Y1UI75_9TREE|nr:survival protein sure-like phosphatase/nucleotidase [Kockovaella imperatae]ORX36795.1 survival protein sure-like phosphatase/nucleotidase [Kockovaella imperatae]
MPKLPVYGQRPCVLLTNDDGPPCTSSPNIYGFCRLLQERLGWDVRVVIPDCQKSWVGKAYAISEIISVSYFYPLAPDGLNGEICTQSRPLRDGESMEWVLLSGTPATCANIALHNLYPGEIDLVISGPNHGRNCSTAFALSSGTLGAALAAALSIPIPGPSTSSISLHEHHIPAIALSYGVVERPVPDITTRLAHEVSLEVIERLWENWGHEDQGEKLVQVYSINVPLVESQLQKDKRRICWTSMRRNAYGQLFKSTQLEPSLNWWKQKKLSDGSAASTTSSAGPGALPSDPATPVDTGQTPEQTKFHFAPAMAPLLTPSRDNLPFGTDAWAFAEGFIGVTPLRAEFAGLTDVSSIGGPDSYAGKEWSA